jgi:Cu2+-exporting ATPase
VALGILITFLVSTAATFEPNGWWGKEVYFDSLTMFVFFLLTGRLLELRMRDKTAGALDALMQRLPASVELKKSDGTFERVAVRRLSVGDVVRILPGESFPADGTIVLGSTNADEALLTGESHAVPKEIGAQVIGGSYNLTSAVQVRLEQIGQNTKYGQIVALMERVSTEKPRLALLADRIAKPFLLIVLIAAAASAIYWWPTDHGRALMAAVAVLIVTCPCALSLATPAAMLTTSGAFARAGILVRKMQAIEALTTVDTIVFDKTGTLTNANIAVGSIKTADNINISDALRIAATIARHSLHPVSRALVIAYEQTASDFDETILNVKEVVGFGLSAHSAEGEFKLGSYQYCVSEGAQIEQKSFTDAAVHLVLNNRWQASFSLAETIKTDAAKAIAQLRAYGLDIEVLSGDKLPSVARISNEVGITKVQGDSTPQGKLNYMLSLQKQGRKVMMVGDGLNDGPVLASASVSVAMGSAVPLAQAQSDFVILSGQLMMLPLLISQSKRTMRIVKQNLLWAALYNAIFVPLAVAGLLPAWLAGLGMALSSLLVILNAVRLNKINQLIS